MLADKDMLGREEGGSQTSLDMGGSRGGRGSGLPLENHRNTGCLAILVRIPWKITKLPSLHYMTGHHRPASETPFKWCFSSGPIMAPAFSGIWILSPPYQLKKRFQSWVGPPLTKLSGSAHVRMLGILQSVMHALYTNMHIKPSQQGLKYIYM